MRSVAALLLLLQLALSTAGAEPPGKKSYTLYATHLTTEGDIVEAKGNIVIYSKDLMFHADKARYDRKKEMMMLEGNVIFFYKGSIVNKADTMRFYIKQNRFSASSVFTQELHSDIWIKSDGIRADKNLFVLKKASLSSCNPADPDWQIRFSSGYYHRDKEFMTLYNPRFYIGKVPVFYLPWFAFPTIRERRSGLLRPVIGLESGENLLFMQPIYIAPSESWDIEFDPQIRFNRGKGLYTTLRFADTPWSKGRLTLGFFNEARDYVAEHNLKNSVHKGFSFLYRSDNLFTKHIKKNPYDYKDGLYVDVTGLNDIDYINLEDDRKYAVDKLVTSRINYYMSGYGDYIGVYGKYFIDTEKISNDDTLQTLPSLQYHKFSQVLGIRNLVYAIDYKFKNSWRREGLGARQHELSLPLVFTMPLLDNYLNVTASENFYYSKVNYTDANASVQNARYLSNYHRFSLQSDLMKRYSDKIHNIQMEVAFTIPSLHKRRGYFADFVPFNLERKNIALKMNNYLYDTNGNGYLTDRFTQYYYYDKADKPYNEAENELILRYSPNLTLRNTLIYSYEYHKLKKIQSGIYYHGDRYEARIDHTYKDAPNETKINFLSADFSHRLDRRYSVLGGVDYDFDNGFTKEWRIGLAMRKKCWSYTLRYKESVTPSLTSGGTRSLTRRGLYLLLRFAHIGGVEYKLIKNVAPGTQTENREAVRIPDISENAQSMTDETTIVSPVSSSPGKEEVP